MSDNHLVVRNWVSDHDRFFFDSQGYLCLSSTRSTKRPIRLDLLGAELSPVEDLFFRQRQYLSEPARYLIDPEILTSLVRRSRNPLSKKTLKQASISDLEDLVYFAENPLNCFNVREPLCGEWFELQAWSAERTPSWNRSQMMVVIRAPEMDCFAPDSKHEVLLRWPAMLRTGDVEEEGPFLLRPQYCVWQEAMHNFDNFGSCVRWPGSFDGYSLLERMQRQVAQMRLEEAEPEGGCHGL